MGAGTGRQPPARLGLGRALVFGGATLPVSAVDTAALIYLSPYLTGVLGLSLTTVGLAFLVVRVADIVVDPLLGIAMDATRSRLGRYRLWMLLGAPVLMGAVWMLFFARPGIGPVYLTVGLFVAYLGRSILHLAHPAWAATLAQSYNDRARLFGVMSAMGVASNLVVLSLPVINARLGGSETHDVALMGWLVILAAPLAIGAAVALIGERVSPAAAAPARLSDYVSLLTKPDLVRLYVAMGFLTFGPGAMTQLYIFFMRDYARFTQAQASILLLAYTLAGLLGAPLIARLATRIGKHRALPLACVGYCLGLCTVLFGPKGNLVGTLPILIWCGFCGVGFELMVRALLADVADQVRLEQGRERLSLIYALNTLVTKVAIAGSVAIAYPLLQHVIGYSPAPGAHNSDAAVRGLGLLFVSAPIICVLLGGASVLGWRLTAARHAEIRTELDLRDAAAASQAALGSAAQA